MISILRGKIWGSKVALNLIPGCESVPGDDASLDSNVVKSDSGEAKGKKCLSCISLPLAWG